ncbi:MAG TPA: ATP-binding cassette domain-containing protein [Planctomycetota bacterium]|nr:ATP-binding cassette domain-containing protein [Planctomycetota bacterium]HRU50659.1 ATP-binding cassette domain-containing protein [Planctomycetota bacterium]
MENIIEFQEFTVRFPQRKDPIFSNITFSIPENSIFGIFGETGCGKSTLSLALNGLLENATLQGQFQLHLDGKTYTNTKIQEKDWKHIRGKYIVYIPQDPYKTLHPWKTIKNQLKLILKYSIPQYSIEEIIDILQIEPHILNLYPHELSAGQVQRCMLALALAKNPKIYILDEPTASIDVQGRQILLQCFQNLQKKGCTLLIISHEIQEYKSIIEPNNSFYFHPLPEFHKLKKQETSNIQKPLLQLSNITKKYNTHIVLNQLDLLLFENYWVYLQGPNGVGKSTLMNIIQGIQKPDTGTFQWQNQEIYLNKIKKEQIENIHCVYQDSSDSLDPNWMIKSSLQEVIHRAPLKLHGQLWTKTEELWQILELPYSLLQHYPHQLSYGQQKRVAILRTLLKYHLYRNLSPTKHHLFLFDEIFSGLHWSLRNKILEHLQTLRQNNDFTILWVAHAQDDLCSLCDVSYTLQNGQLIQNQEK